MNTQLRKAKRRSLFGFGVLLLCDHSPMAHFGNLAHTQK